MQRDKKRHPVLVCRVDVAEVRGSSHTYSSTGSIMFSAWGTLKYIHTYKHEQRGHTRGGPGNPDVHHVLVCARVCV